MRGVSDSLRLDGNAFVSPLPDFTAATVTGLHIENNRFAEPFPAAALTLAPGLSTLFMENNSFTGALELPPTFLLQNAAYGFTLQVGGNKLTGMTIDPALCDFIQYYRASGSGFIYTMPNMWELNYTCDTVNDLIRICGGDSSGTFALQQACTPLRHCRRPPCPWRQRKLRLQPRKLRLQPLRQLPQQAQLRWRRCRRLQWSTPPPSRRCALLLQACPRLRQTTRRSSPACLSAWASAWASASPWCRPARRPSCTACALRRRPHA